MYYFGNTNDKDILIVKVTGQAYSTEYDVAIQNWKQAGLLSPSVIRVHKIQTLYSSLIIGQTGRLTLINRFKACKTNLRSFSY